MIRIRDLTLAPGEDPSRLRSLAAKALHIRTNQIQELIVRKRSVDARHKNAVRIVYTVDLRVEGNEQRLVAHAKGKAAIVEISCYRVPIPDMPIERRPVVVGFGPAGIFAALVLAMAGLRPLVLERGQDIDSRISQVKRFWQDGALNPESNVQFGEGGAGTFSDGKLNTGINDPRISWVLQQLHQAGADESILIDARPHIGTDMLRQVVKNLRTRIISLGGEVRFQHQLTGLQWEQGHLTGAILADQQVIPCSELILAIGHSARDTFEMLLQNGVSLAAKAFSMGVRIEHLQADIDQAQYGQFAGNPYLPPADYRLSCHFPEGDSAYTFCMCPGGYVVAAASETGGVVTNGMSEFRRDAVNANAALLVTLEPASFPVPGPLGGMYWQRQIEQRAFAAGGGDYRAPAQLVGDFLAGQPSIGAGRVRPSYRPGVTWCDLHQVLPEEITTTLAKALPALGRKLAGFDMPEAVLTAPETRSSSPVRILRDDTLQSTCRGLYPCGEGAGYAGGIISAAVDGMRCAEALIANLEP